MIKKIIKGIVLVLFFFAAFVVSERILNNGSDDKIISMGDPTLPRISFLSSGSEINPLSGYGKEMDRSTMRDTITPMEQTGALQMKVEAEGNEIRSVDYEVYLLKGKEPCYTGEAKPQGEDGLYTMDLGNAFDRKEREAELKVVLTVSRDGESRKVRYYTRIIRPDEVTAQGCLAFAKDFQGKALSKGASEELASYLEPGTQSDNSTYQTVNIHSDITHVQWGDMKPNVIGKVHWNIKETNSVYSSLQAKYQVSCEREDGGKNLYNVKEFFRIRIAGERIYLLDYNREMEEIFDGEDERLGEAALRIGISSEDFSMEVNEDGTKAAFVQERDLWLLDRETGRMTQVFSFSKGKKGEERDRNDQHEVRIIRMDQDGSVAFAVYGYMNRGDHEGEVGAGIYYYDAGKNLIQEKAFLPSTKSFAIAREELGKMVYYNHDKETLFVLANGTLYQINLDTKEQEILAENLGEGQYTVCDDGHIVAYQTAGERNMAKEIRVMDLNKGSEYLLQAAEGEAILPKGFVNSDFLFGKMKIEDVGTLASGEEVFPMYELDIRNASGETVTEYSFTDQGIYITDILVEGKMVTLNRAKKNGSAYQVTTQEFITNNEEHKESSAQVESYSENQAGKLLRIRFLEGMEKKEVSVLHPNQMMSDHQIQLPSGKPDETVKYYVYGQGELKGIYDRAGFAIQRAEQIAGVVVSSRQDYIWEKGNRDLAYATDGSGFQRADGETEFQACERYMERYAAEKIDLTGCTLEQVMYVINKGCPAIALLGGDEAVLLISYTKTDITYVNPSTGGTKTVGIGEMEKKLSKSGNMVIGYVK